MNILTIQWVHVRAVLYALMLCALPLQLSTEAAMVASVHGASEWWVESRSALKKAKRLGLKEVRILPVPVLGIATSTLRDTWGEARSHGRSHEGIDIVASRGALVVSPTRAVIMHVGENKLGGKIISTANPGGERYYFAHLDGFAKGLKAGQEVASGDLLGYVGNTGNASSTIPHLHFGIYTGTGRAPATNPYPRILTIFKDEHIQALIARERMKQQAALTKAQTAARLKLEKEKRQIEKKAQQRVREDATR